MAALFISLTASVVHGQTENAGQQKLRSAGVAGSFYPADPAALAATMDSMLAQVPAQQIDGQILAVVAPHAGYPYSGPVAAYTYASLKGLRFSRIVVIAPSHFESFDFTSVYDGDGYVTPLGTVPVDKIFVQQLSKMNSSIRLSERGHAPTSQGAEHALEVQLPWLQHVVGSFTLVPIIMGDQSYENSRALGVSLAKLIQRESKSPQGKDSQESTGATLIVASSDLSHYHTYDDAERIDHKTLGALQSWDYLSMSRNFEMRVWEACGGGPIVAAMIAAERLGANKANVLKYANSGDTSGDHSRVVGYSADVFVKAQPEAAEESPFSLNEEEKEDLLTLARNSVESAVKQHKRYEPEATKDDLLNRERGAFVTIKEEGDLRGCIGNTAASEPLSLTVRDTAMLAALRDPRFRPVSTPELPRLHYEISVLSSLRRVMDVREIHVGEHGLLIKKGDREGILLPQVPVEQHWDRIRFLQETCFKAGMPPECWREEDTDIFRFTAVVFEEHEPTHANQPKNPGLPEKE
jgi:AmmeMemoRadiSam system protein B/AmmeMemoRadiSam system protein A